MTIQPGRSLVAPAVESEVFFEPFLEGVALWDSSRNNISKPFIVGLGKEPHRTQDKRPVAPVGVLILVKLAIGFDAFDCEVVAQPLLNVGF